MTRLVQLIYASRASPSLDEQAIPALLETSRRRNAAAGITGMLLYVEGSFFQVLEGEAASVAETFARIHNDACHGRVTQIISEPIFERAFTDWTMGFANVDLAQVQSRIGENDFFTSATCLEQLSPGRARKLLNAFGQGRWRAEETGVHCAHARMA